MIALGGPKLKQMMAEPNAPSVEVSMIALGGPKLKHSYSILRCYLWFVSMIALGGPKLKPLPPQHRRRLSRPFQ